MNVLTKAQLVRHIIQWRLRWDKRDTRSGVTVPGNPKFMGPRDAVALIPDGAGVMTSGLAGNQRAAILYWAIRETFEETGHPRDLTVMCTGGQGGRGKVPGSLDELGVDGLTRRMVTGHQETFKGFLRLAAQGKCELQCIPQGVIAFLLESQGRGEDSVVSGTGVGTFIDPRIGSGSHVFDPNAEQFVAVEGDALRYRMPKVTVGLFGAPAADRAGNVYLRNASVVAETFELVRAARVNGGKVIANVGTLVDAPMDGPMIPAGDVDAVVVDPNCEQAVSIRHKKYWPLLTTHSNLPTAEAIERLRFINRVLGITPRRTQADEVLARLAASVFVENARPGALFNIGVGLPEEVCRILYETGVLDRMTAFTESGVIGGLPAPGVFFGAAACPERMVSSASMFRIAYEQLDSALLGVLEADGEGNVNVSKRGEGPINYVGPGGFIDLTTAAKTIVFVTTWMAHSTVLVEGDRIRIAKPGSPKFIEKVSEITFSGKEALRTGKNVLYVTSVGVFRLTHRGMEFIKAMPGIDIERDVLAGCGMRVVLPESGSVPIVDTSIVTGKDFALRLADVAA